MTIDTTATPLGANPPTDQRTAPDSSRRIWQTRRDWVVVADSDRCPLGLYRIALRSTVFGSGGRLRR